VQSGSETQAGLPRQLVHVAFVWHMHQPYYRSARTAAFQMPWARLHALKDYLDMVEILADYPTIHQTFNLVPSLVEQLQDYASGGLPKTAAEAIAMMPGAVAPAGAASGLAAPLADAALGARPVTDVYWQHTIKPATELLPGERAFIVERMCERPDHPRAKSHPRYLELSLKRQVAASLGWDRCAAQFSSEELRDLQIWFDLAWFDPTLLETEPLLSLVRRGRDYREEDKRILAEVQNDTFARIIPAYQRAAAARQIELSTSPYFHPILPLLANTDSARIGAGDTILPHRRFSHPEDAWDQVESGVAKHEEVFGARPQGMWCSEQSVGEDVLPLLMRADIRWTISDESVLSRSFTGSAPAAGVEPSGPSPYLPYLLRREERELAIVFRDHTLSDLIGFGYQSWDSRDAANDLLDRIRAIGASHSVRRAAWPAPPLVTIALDGENAWEYYPHDGRDFLHFLYEGLAADPNLSCVTVSEHLADHPATTPLDWLHTGSWIGADLRTWSGDPGHNAAWDLLHDARDLAAARRQGGRRSPVEAITTFGGEPGLPEPPQPGTPAGEAAAANTAADAAWHHVCVTEGSDWFWWFGEHHHTELDYVWDLEFRQHLQEVYRQLGEPVPIRLYLPVFAAAAVARRVLPVGPITPIIDGRISDEDGWDKAGVLTPDHPSTMQRSEGTRIVEARFGWGSEQLFVLLIPRDSTDLEGLQIELTVTPPAIEDESVFHVSLSEDGGMQVSCTMCGHLTGIGTGAWRDVVEIALPLAAPAPAGNEHLGIVLRVGRDGMTDHVFRSAGLAPVGEP
jgi:alpha-amylase/alpha-mannosidase (GH57 family)